MPPADIVRSATMVAAELLRASGRLGAVAPGAAAELIAVDCDPSTDITSLSRVRLVISQGRVSR